MLDTLGTQE